MLHWRMVSIEFKQNVRSITVGKRKSFENKLYLYVIGHTNFVKLVSRWMRRIFKTHACTHAEYIN